jgi:hypothetical protein
MKLLIYLGVLNYTDMIFILSICILIFIMSLYLILKNEEKTAVFSMVAFCNFFTIFREYYLHI